MVKRSKAPARHRRIADGRRSAPATARAQELNALWARLQRAHALVGGSCACGHGQAHVRPEDFEYYVLGHLARKYRAAGEEQLARLLGHGAGAVASLQMLLDRLAQVAAGRGLSATRIALLLDDLQRSLESFADAAR